MPLRVGYNLFKGASQAGVKGDLTPGIFEIEQGDNPSALSIRVQRLSDNQYYNFETKAWGAGDPGAENYQIPGSEKAKAFERFQFRMPLPVCLGITAAGCVVAVYPKASVTPTGAAAATEAYLTLLQKI